jgi:hypothetical protein
VRELVNSKMVEAVRRKFWWNVGFRGKRMHRQVSGDWRSKSGMTGLES